MMLLLFPNGRHTFELSAMVSISGFVLDDGKSRGPGKLRIRLTRRKMFLTRLEYYSHTDKNSSSCALLRKLRRRDTRRVVSLTGARELLGRLSAGALYTGSCSAMSLGEFYSCLLFSGRHEDGKKQNKTNCVEGRWELSGARKHWRYWKLSCFSYDSAFLVSVEITFVFFRNRKRDWWQEWTKRIKTWQRISSRKRAC